MEQPELRTLTDLVRAVVALPNVSIGSIGETTADAHVCFWRDGAYMKATLSGGKIKLEVVRTLIIVPVEKGLRTAMAVLGDSLSKATRSGLGQNSTD